MVYKGKAPFAAVGMPAFMHYSGLRDFGGALLHKGAGG